MGVDFLTKTISVLNSSVQLQVWDTAGQERFRAITASYFRGAMGAIICYDCTDERSFTSAEEWIKDFKKMANEVAPVILVANKIDLREKSEVINS